MLQLRSVLAPRRTLAAASLLLTAVACGGGGGDGSTSPKPPVTTVAVTVPTQIVTASNAGALGLQVVATYDRTSGTAGTLGTQTIAITGSGAQTVGPFTLDLAPCLNDAARTGGTTATTCAVHLQLTLLAGGTAVDAQNVGPYTVAGGATLTVNPAVSFVQIASVKVVPVTGPAPAAGAAARVVLGGPLPLSAQVLDAAGNPVAGRAVVWSSSATNVATVDATSGVVTPVAVGSTVITAVVAGQTATLTVNVVSPPNPVAVSVGGGLGSGSVISNKQPGISCRVTNGVASQTCMASFASDSAVTLTATPDAGSSFGGWGDACQSAGTALTCTVTPSTALGVQVTFASTRTTTAVLTLNSAGPGGGYVTSAQSGATGTIDCHRIGGVTLGALCAAQYGTGTQVTLTATPDALSTFQGWTGACSSSGPTCVVTIGTTEAIPTATFAAAPSANGVSVAPTGSGAGGITITTTVVSAPCTRDQVNRPDGGTCIAPWNPANVPATIIIKATPASGSQFKGWTGCPSGVGAECDVPRNGVFAVSAQFEPATP